MSFETIAERWADRVVEHRFKVIATCLIAAGLVTLGATRSAFSTDYRIFFPDGDPKLASLDAFEQVFTSDQLLTNLMLYVMTGSFTTGAWYYRAMLEEGGPVLAEGQRCETPTAFANFPGESIYKPPPRSWADRAYNITRWSEMPRGGHFAAMEEPGLFVDDVRAWAREL